MRRLLPLFLFVVSCSKSDSSDEVLPTPLEFTLSTTVMRSSVVESYLDVDNCVAYGYYNTLGDLFLEELLLERNLRSWCHNSPLTWEEINDRESSFVAYSPMATERNGISVSLDNESIALNYVTPSLSADHPYIMLSYPAWKAVGNTDHVTFIMQHPLCVVTLSSEEELPIEEFELVGVVTEGRLSLDAAGRFEWDLASSVCGSVAVVPGDSAMMIPCTLGEGALLRAVAQEESLITEFSLAGDVWSPNERVDYTLAVDSYGAITLRREPIL